MGIFCGPYPEDRYEHRTIRWKQKPRYPIVPHALRTLSNPHDWGKPVPLIAIVLTESQDPFPKAMPRPHPK